MAHATADPSSAALALPDDRWHDIGAVADLIPGTGAAALIGDVQVAVVRTLAGTVHALGHFDPTSRAMVLARGIVGDHGGVPVITSPITKAAFALATGDCLDRPGVRVPLHAARVRGDRIEVRLSPPTPTGGRP